MKPTSLSTGMNMYLGFVSKLYFGFVNELMSIFWQATPAQDALDSVSLNKMDHLMEEYDLLLRSQLLDQQLYFEKLLAKETVKALELSFQLEQQQVL